MSYPRAGRSADALGIEPGSTARNLAKLLSLRRGAAHVRMETNNAPRMLQILLAEDNPGDVLLVKRALEKHDVQHELHVVRNGAEALKYLATIGEPGGADCPDLVLLDVNLPFVDGPEILRAMRANPGCARTQVIVITSSDASKDRARMSELGIDRYFTKPSSLDAYLELGQMIVEVTGRVR